MKQLLTVLALAALAACGGNKEADDANDTGAATTPEATAPATDPAASSAPVTDPAAAPAVHADSAAAVGTTTPAPAAGTDSAPAAPASH